MRKRLIHGSIEGVDPIQSKAADICLYSKELDRLIIVEGEKFSATSFPADKYSPVGVVVVPGTHNVYGDGSCGVMSLKEMCATNPNNGSSNNSSNNNSNIIYLYWGQYDIDSGIIDHPTVVRGNEKDGLATGNPTYYSYLPSDQFSLFQCLHDIDAYYHDRDSELEGAPSPYLTDDSRNPGYPQTSSPSSFNNVLSDFNGRDNSKRLWNGATQQSDWRTSKTIDNENNSGSKYSPAACCCWRYHTEGTQQGDWYLPAGGELGYIIPPFSKINKTIVNMQNVYGASIGVALNSIYWSSSEFSIDCACVIVTGNGCVNMSESKRNGHHTRAFFRINANGIIRS